MKGTLISKNLKINTSQKKSQNAAITLMMPSRVKIIRKTKTKEVRTLRKTSQRMKNNSSRTPTWRVTKKMKMRAEVRKRWKNRSLQVKNVLTNCAVPKRYTKSCVPKWSMPNIVSFADSVTKVITVMTFVNSANKFTRAPPTLKMTTNGSDVIHAADG